MFCLLDLPCSYISTALLWDSGMSNLNTRICSRVHSIPYVSAIYEFENIVKSANRNMMNAFTKNNFTCFFKRKIEDFHISIVLHVKKSSPAKRFLSYLVGSDARHFSMLAGAIEKLEDSVVNRIAAGEIIHHPSNVVKELVENSIDAHAQQISVEIENGGYSLIKVSDNGTGIRLSDLPVACRRHTTSKIRQFSDLTKISTFGFRGEALFSMSCCSHLTILTKTEDDDIGHSASFAEGELAGSISAAHALVGTTVEIRDLFYSNSVRLSGRSKPNVDSRKVADIILKYSVVYPAISFIFVSSSRELYRSFGNATFDVVLRQIYSIEETDAFFKLVFEIPPSVHCELFLSSPGNAKTPKSSTIFINGRLISSDRIKRGMESAYSEYLPKGQHPFYFLVLTLPPHDVDVNIHPSKREVRFLNEADIIAAICERVKSELDARKSQRPVEVFVPPSPRRLSQRHSPPKSLPPNQTVISQYSEPRPTEEPLSTPDSSIDHDSEPDEIGHEFQSPPPPPNHPDILEQVFHEIENPRPKQQFPSNPDPIPHRPPAMVYLSDDDEHPTNSVRPRVLAPERASLSPKRPEKPKRLSLFDELRFEPVKSKALPVDPTVRTLEQVLTAAPRTVIPRPFRHVELESILEMRANVGECASPDLSRVFHDHSFVGFIGLKAFLIHGGDGLYMCSIFAVLRNFFYQKLLHYFAIYPQFRLDPPINISETAGPDVMAEIQNHASLLGDHFSMSIENGVLYSMPHVLEGFTPSFSAMPLFLRDLALEVNWEEERSCYEGILGLLASLYSVVPDDEDDAALAKRLQHELMTVVIPEMRKETFRPSTCLVDEGSVVLVELPDFG
jgi:DNA mismatch repair protein MLH1